ncbi:putative katanin P80 subunit [Schistosoma mansoni]|uniref:putative katanin P80 subunit n=1 Tax=Schistosoma mansoni TaxID=6183 RepID=UPI00022DCC50|nr:putative katanin P80 subunit [Schistosoma mansoni]|eukprot:XP_018654340.1 putative katanin P80 subunit [Schistosoma mansoni]
MATGGEDRRLKLWAVGKPSCILSLTGHTSSIEACEFSQEEDRVAAGSLSGSVRIWDLEEVKIVRALSGHTSAIKTLDFHPYGNFVASGSMDTLVKLWDVSRKGCINTYRGHTGSVNMIRFSPDGKWIVSAGEDGIIKIYDYENMSCLETVHVGWRAGGGLDDMAVAPSFNQLVGVCISNSLITTYVVDVKSCIPFTTNYSDNIVESNKDVCAQSTQLITTGVNTSANYNHNDNSNSIPTIHSVQQICGNSNLVNYMQRLCLTNLQLIDLNTELPTSALSVCKVA